MPGSDLPNYRTPSPDAGHEAIRAPLAKAIDDLAEAIAGVDDSYFLTGMLFTLVDSLLAQAGEVPAEYTALSNKVADLEARLVALEPPVFEPDAD